MASRSELQGLAKLPCPRCNAPQVYLEADRPGVGPVGYVRCTNPLAEHQTSAWPIDRP